MGDPYFRTFASYNRWANGRLYDACAQLPDAERKARRPAFFGSIHATLNHLLVGDRIWMGRMAGESVQLRLDQILDEEFAELRAARQAQDEALIRLVDDLDPARLDEPLQYKTTRGDPQSTPWRIVLGHLFNHQTHHRAQVHDMLSQTSVPPPELDLIYFVRQG